MGLLLAGLFTIAVVLFIIWCTAVAKSDAADRSAAKAQAEEERKQARLEARLKQRGEPLVCLHCNTHFAGPLAEDGCPNCHMSTLVVPASDVEYQSETGSRNEVHINRTSTE